MKTTIVLFALAALAQFAHAAPPKSAKTSSPTTAASPAPTASPTTTATQSTTAGTPIALVPVAGTTVVGTPITALPSAPFTGPVAGCTGIGTQTRNDIVEILPCKNLTLIFARGTFEGGNMGSIVGPPFVAALENILGADQVAVQGVNDYLANVEGFQAGGSATGAANVVDLVRMTMAQCPATKLCISGYSQGAQVVHLGAKRFTQAETDFINSAVLWGDPYDGTAVGAVPAGKTSVDCHSLDDICYGGNVIGPDHLNYCLDADREARFAVALSGLSA